MTEGVSSTDRPRIVVGVDDSPAARRALRWAAEEARLRGTSLLVLSAWSWGSTVLPTATPLSTPTADVVRRQAAQRLDAIVVEVLGDRPSVPVVNELVYREDGAAAALVEASKQADLVVVGSRGRGGFTGLLLGSVSAQVTHHAHCPVVVVQGGRGAEGDRPAAG